MGLSNKSPDVPPNQPKSAAPGTNQPIVAAETPARLAATPMIPTWPPLRPNLLQLRGDVRLVASIDLIHNIFVLCFAINDALTWHEYGKAVENNKIARPWWKEMFDVIKIIPYYNDRVDKTQDWNQTLIILESRFKSFMYLAIIGVILSTLGIWAALRLYRETDLNRGGPKSKNWARGWRSLNIVLCMYYSMGIIITYRLVSNVYVSMVTFLLIVRLGSGLTVKRFMREFDIDARMEMPSTALVQTDNNATNSSEEPEIEAHGIDQASTIYEDKRKIFIYHLPATITICDRPSNPPRKIHSLPSHL